MAHRLRQLLDEDDQMIDAGQEFDQLSWNGPDERFDNDAVINWNKTYLSQQWHPADDIHPPPSAQRPSPPLSEAGREKLREAESTLREIQRTASNAAMLSGHLDRAEDEQFYLNGVDNVTADLGEVLDVLKNRKRRGAMSEGPTPNFRVGKRTLSQAPQPMKATVRKTHPRYTGRKTDVTSAPTEIRRKNKNLSPKGQAQSKQAAEVVDMAGLKGILDPDWETKQKLNKAIDDLSTLKVNLAHITKEYDNMEDFETANAMFEAGVGRSREPDWNPEEQPVPPQPVYVDRSHGPRNSFVMSSSPDAQNLRRENAMDWQMASSSPAALRAAEQQHAQAAAAGVYLPSPLRLRFANQSIQDQGAARVAQPQTPENLAATNEDLFSANRRAPNNRRLRLAPPAANDELTQQYHERFNREQEAELGDDEDEDDGDVQPIPFRLQMPRDTADDVPGLNTEEHEAALSRYELRAQWDARREEQNRQRLRQRNNAIRGRPAGSLVGPARATGGGRGGGGRQHPYQRPEPRRR